MTAYHDEHPDPAAWPQQRVVRHLRPPRLEPAHGSFNEDHIVAISQAICEYRRGAGHRRPAVPRPRHARAVRAGARRTRAGGVRRQRRRRADRQPRRLHADAGAVARDPAPTTAAAPRGLADGVVVTPSHNPPERRRLQVQPAHGGPADTDVTRWIQDRANELLADGLKEVRRDPVRPRPGPRTPPARTTSSARYVDDLPSVLDLDAIRDAGRADRRRPAGRRERRLLGRDRRAARPRPHRGQPDVDPTLAVHDAGLGRQDPDGLLVAVRDGVADRAARRRTRSPPATTPTPTGTASSRPDAGLMNPNHYLAVAIDYLFRTPHRLAGGRRDRQDAGVVVDDRPGRRRPRPPAARGAGRVQVVRAGPARRLGRLRRRGERRRVVPAPRRQRLDHRQGRHPAVPARLGDHSR